MALGSFFCGFVQIGIHSKRAKLDIYIKIFLLLLSEFLRLIHLSLSFLFFFSYIIFFLSLALCFHNTDGKWAPYRQQWLVFGIIHTHIAAASPYPPFFLYPPLETFQTPQFQSSLHYIIIYIDSAFLLLNTQQSIETFLHKEPVERKKIPL